MSFGKTTIGASQWYCAPDGKYGAVYPTTGLTVNMITANIKNDPYAASLPIVRALLYNAATGVILAKSIDFQLTRSVQDTTMSSRQFPIPSTVLPAGNYVLMIQVGGNGAIRFGYDSAASAIGYEVTDAFSDGPSNPIGSAATSYHGYDIYASGTAPPPQPVAPTPIIQTDQQVVLVNTPVTFDGSSSLPGTGMITLYSWNFGDDSPIATGVRVTHTYAATGTYTLTLTVTTSEVAPYNTGSASAPIPVSQPTSITLTVQGTTSPTPSTYTFTVGSTYSFQAATPPPGSIFGFWTLDAETYGNNPMNLEILPYMNGKTLKPIYVSANSSILKIGFENPADFSMGRTGTWTRASHYYGSSATVDPDSTVVRRQFLGSQSCRLALLDTTTDMNRRNEILHDWDVLATAVMWLEAWIYIPTDFQLGSFVAIFRPLYERYWGPGDTPYYWYNGANLGIYNPDGRSSRPTYGQPILNLYMNHGEVEPATPLPVAFELYLSDMQQKYDSAQGKFDWIEPYKSNPSLRLTLDNLKGKWFKIKCRVNRNYSNWNDGRIAWWIALPPDYVETSLWQPNNGADEHGWNPDTAIRTIGISPTLMAQRQAQDWEQAYFCTGFSNYTDIGAPVSRLYLDDVLLTGTQQMVLVYTLTLTQTTGGIISVSPNQQTFQAGATATITATPNSGYVFGHWRVDGADTALTVPTLGVTMNGDHAVQAVFTALVPVAISISPLSASITVGQSVALTAVPVQGQAPYTVSWINEANGATLGSGSTYILTPTQAGTYNIHAVVTDNLGGAAQSQTATITANPIIRMVTIQINGSGTTNPVAGSYSVNNGSTVNVTATPSAGYRFSGWTVNGQTTTANPLSVTATSDLLIVASFVNITHIITIQVSGQGSTNPVTGTYTQNEGTTITVTATPTTGYTFTGWMIDGTPYTTNPVTVTMNMDHTALAQFAVIPPPATYTLSITSNLSGFYATVNGVQKLVPYSEALTGGSYALAVPSNLTVGSDIYNFTQWADGSTSPTKTIQLTADTPLTVEYTKQAPPPPAKGNLEVHTYLDGNEVVAPCTISQTGESFNAPATLSESPGAYTVSCTVKTQTKQLSATIVANQTIRLDFQFTTPPPTSPLIPAILGSVIIGGFALSGDSKRRG